jgi:hypothetical protein
MDYTPWELWNELSWGQLGRRPDILGGLDENEMEQSAAMLRHIRDELGITDHLGRAHHADADAGG